jgi:hypothetical protein
MAKDKIYGLIILVVGIVIAILYTFMVPVDLYMSEGVWLDAATNPNPGFFIAGLPDVFNWRWGLALPIYLIVIVICLIAVWIGYSMVTTPPPVPLEELEEELEAEEAKEGKKPEPAKA